MCSTHAKEPKSGGERRCPPSGLFSFPAKQTGPKGQFFQEEPPLSLASWRSQRATMLCMLGCAAAYTADSALVAQRQSELDNCLSTSGTDKDTAWCKASCAASAAACPASFCDDGCRDAPTETGAETPTAGAADEADAAVSTPSSKDWLQCTTYVAANPATTHLWCTAACADGCSPEDQLVCKCDEDEETAEQADEHACVSISVKKTTEWCNLACGLEDGGCPRDAVKHCKCGADALEPSIFSKAADAAVAREKAANEAMASQPPLDGVYVFKAPAEAEPPPGGVYVGQDGLVKARVVTGPDSAEQHTFGDGHNHDVALLRAESQS